MIASRREPPATEREPLERAATAPVVAAVELDTVHSTADTAAQLARDFDAPLAFVTVRPPLGDAADQRRLTRDLLRARKVLDVALDAASRHGVMSYGEVVEGDVVTKILEFARARDAQLLVVGTRRRRDAPSVSRQVVAAADRPVHVAAPCRAVSDPRLRRMTTGRAQRGARPARRWRMTR